MLKNKRNMFIYKTAIVLKSFKGPWMTTIILKKKGLGRTVMETENDRKKKLLSHPFNYKVSLLKNVNSICTLSLYHDSFNCPNAWYIFIFY